MSLADSESSDLHGSLNSLSREHQICELVVKIQLRLEAALDKLLECQRKQGNLLRLERMDISSSMNFHHNTCQTRLRLQQRIKDKTRQEFLVEGADFDMDQEKAILESQAQELRREIEMLKSKADMWKLQLNL